MGLFGPSKREQNVNAVAKALKGKPSDDVRINPRNGAIIPDPKAARANAVLLRALTNATAEEVKAAKRRIDRGGEVTR